MTGEEQAKMAYPAWDFNPVPEALSSFTQGFEASLAQARTRLPFPALLGGLATSALVFLPRAAAAADRADRLLLIQRAAHDSMPNKWEPPGGAADPEDPSVLHACARELFEEAGLVASRVLRVVGDGDDVDGDYGSAGMVFMNRSGTRLFVKFCFEVEVEAEAGAAAGVDGADGDGRPVVRLDANEHQDWVWATEEEVKNDVTADGKPIPVTTLGQKRILLNAFRLRREEAEAEAKGET
ncbi:hypothetical protein N3K66_007588 [Trichothecium roseum]|uniref:Uncharacterized protein n=1 Tax=Trichothecium roseum TaxID=47278 RepID=A0ACC0UW40_9HYPO|nr:hypothetical protein N3K66_007588 [Trichothecium roseum]